MNSIMCFSHEAQITNQASPTAFQFVYMVLAIDITDGHSPSSEVHPRKFTELCYMTTEYLLNACSLVIALHVLMSFSI